MSGEDSTKSGNIKLSADSDDEDIYGNNYDFRDCRGGGGWKVSKRIMKCLQRIKR